MKKKAILALIAAMTLSMASVGTVFAAVNNGGNGKVTEQAEHIHTWGDPFYVKDADAVYEHHEAVYGEDVWVVDVPEITEIHTVCFTCGLDYTTAGMSMEAMIEHMYNHQINGESDQYGSQEVVVQEEQGHYEKGELITPAYDELVTPELGHWEHTCSGCGETQNSETGEVIKPGTLPEEPTEPSEPTEPEQPTDPSQPSEPSNPGTNPGDGETTTPTEPGDNTDNPEDTEKPEDNQSPSEDTEKPEDNQNPSEDTETPEDNQSPSEDTEKPEDNQSPSEDTEKPDESQNPSEDTQDTETNQEAGTEVEQENTDTTETLEGTEVEQESADTTENTVEAQETRRKSPKTGDPANLMYLVTLAGSALTGGTVLGFKRRNRK